MMNFNIFYNMNKNYSILQMNNPSLQMNWKQISAQRPVYNDTSEIVKIKSENIKLQAELKQKDKAVRLVSIQIQQLKQIMSQTEKQLKDILHKLGYQIGSDYSVKVSELMKVLREWVVESEKKSWTLEQQLKKINANRSEEEKSKTMLSSKLNALTLEFERYQAQTKQLFKKKEEEKNYLKNEKQELLKKNIEINESYQSIKKQIEQLRNSNKESQISQQIKNECQALLQEISVEDDQYLRGYLIQNSKYQKAVDNYSRRDKYNFIFD